MAEAEPEAPFAGTRLATLAELDDRLAAGADAGDVWLDMPIDPSLDPLSAAYRDVVRAYYHSLAGEARPGPESGGIPAEAWAGFRPWPYASGDGVQLGSWLQALGFIIGTCRLRRGHRVLQFGAGEGGLALPLAQMGCSVTALDAERRNIDVIRYQAERAGVAVRALHAGFDGAVPALGGQRFDFVMFHGSFHRCYDHVAMLRTVRDDLLVPGGRLVLAGEPLLEALPVPWGLNPAGPEVCAMRRGGGPSLVFRPSYLLAALSACGYAASLSVCSQTAFGNVILGRRMARQATISS